MKTILVGDGTVGKALGKAMGIKPQGKSDDTINADVVIITVPTLTIKGEQDLSQVYQVMDRLIGWVTIQPKLVILRSTVLPGTTYELEKRYPWNIIFVPEFGFEKTMVKDLKHPDYYLLGSEDKDDIKLAKKVLPKAKKYIQMRSISAEFAKYFCNMWGSTQITLANTLYDWAKDPVVYEQALKGALMHKNIPKWGWKIWDQGSRGWGGKCLLKDYKAAISKFPHPVWVEMDKYNDKLIRIYGKK